MGKAPSAISRLSEGADAPLPRSVRWGGAPAGVDVGIEAPRGDAVILLVDDRPANLLALEAVIEPLGHPVVLASSGDEALSLVARQTFALIVLDVMMPGVDGFQTAALIRERHPDLRVPIIFLSAVNCEDSDFAKGYAQGAVDYLVKPFDPDILRSKVSVFVELFQQREEIRRQLALLVEHERREREHERARAQLAAQEAERDLREQLLAIVGHDLRSPLSAILLHAEGLMERDDLPASAARTVTRIAASAERMARMIAQLLDRSRGRMGGGIPVELEDASLSAICRQAIEELEAATPGRSIVYEESEAITGRFDPDRLGQVVSNLVGNALQHGGTSDVTVRVRAVAFEAVLEVHNGGPCIPAELVPHLFDAFRRGSREAKSSSLGLGLYITREIVVAHRGAITVTSTPEDGTRFTVRLPLHVALEGE